MLLWLLFNKQSAKSTLINNRRNQYKQKSGEIDIKRRSR